MATLGGGFGQISRGRVLGRCSNCAAARNTPHLFAIKTRPGTAHRVTTPRMLLQHKVRFFSSGSGHGPRFSHRLGEALRNSRIQWYQIPVGLGIGFLGLVQFYKVSSREQEKQRKLENGETNGSPRSRPRVRPEGPWYELTWLPARGLAEVADFCAPGKSRSCRLCLSRPCRVYGANSMN